MNRLKDKAEAEAILDDVWSSLNGFSAQAAADGRPRRDVSQGSRDDAYILRLEQEVPPYAQDPVRAAPLCVMVSAMGLVPCRCFGCKPRWLLRIEKLPTSGLSTAPI